jgi:hypothetical protein
MVLTDAQNYAFDSSLFSTPQTVQAYADITIDWSGLSTDILDRSMEPGEVDQLLLVRIDDATPEEVLADLAMDDLKQSDVYGIAEYWPTDGATSALLSDFLVVPAGSILEPSEILEPGPTYLLAAITESLGGVRMLGFMDAQTDSEVVSVLLDTETASLTYTVDLEHGERIQGVGSLVDWADLSQDMVGKTLKLNKLDELILGRYTVSVEAIESDFLRVKELADDLWEVNVEGLPGLLDLNGQESLQGSVFQGFDETDTWLIGLLCGTCYNPAPLFLGRVEAVAED